MGFRSHLPSDESEPLLCRRRHHRIRNHIKKPAITEKTTPAAAPTPALKAIVCVSGVELPRICWFVGVAVLVDPVPVVEARFDVEADPAVPDVELLEACELKPELLSDAIDDSLLEEAVEIIESVEDVDMATTADELCAAELDAAVDAVLVCCSPTTPMIVCAVPSETWNVPLPVVQSHIPSALSG